jgi:superfamily II DNA or RNA helicase
LLEKQIRTVIVSTEGNDLLGQWLIQINTLATENRGLFRVHKHFGSSPGPSFREMNNFQLDYLDSILITSNTNLKSAIELLPASAKGGVLLIHDEVHRIGSPTNRESLKGLSSPLGWVLGLSATPEREYDDEGNKFIEEYIGPIIFQYDLKNAISDGILCPFNYHPIKYQSTQEDKDNIAAVFKQQAARSATGRPMSDVELYIALSKVYKLSLAKIPLFDKFIKSHSEYLKRAIVFVEEKWYGDRIMEIIHKYRSDFHTYFSEDEVDTLKRFAKGDLECLITCHKVSEGIDINSLENVILFSSARAKLETIQRIGRCLRVDPKNPNKFANVIDFIRVDEEKYSADDERLEWLSDLSSVKPRVNL